MSLAFLTPNPALPALSPLHGELAAAGATFELRDGWRVATRVAPPEVEARAIERAVGWADLSHLPKFELHGPVDGPLGTARRQGRAWWCPVTPRRTLVVGARVAGGVDVTTQLAAVLLAGPAARETIARFCAIDLRPPAAPPGSFRPGSIARTPGAVLVPAPDRYLLLFGAAVAAYLWTVVDDAGTSLAGRAVGVDAVRVEEVAHA
jgi:glycine cleavage system aminomethyltransferase T